MNVEIRAWLHPYIVSFKGAVRTSCPPANQDEIEGTVAYGAEVYGSDQCSVTDKFGVEHHEIPLVAHADYKALEEKYNKVRDESADYQDACCERNETIECLTAELAECRKDAERYRAIRDAVPAKHVASSIWPVDGYVFAMRFDQKPGIIPSQSAIGGLALDQAIDISMTAKEPIA